jgi:hypothetical protein
MWRRLYAIPTQRLRSIERLIGRAEQAIEIGPFVRERDPDADSGAKSILTSGVEGGFKCLAHPLGQPKGVMPPRIWQKAGELLASNPAKEVVRPQMRSRQPAE